MNEMVERVARAIFASWRQQMDEDGRVGLGPASFDEMDGEERGFGIIAARAAIEAMQVPTQPMLDAGYSAGTGDWGGRYDNRQELARGRMLPGWKAMIAEILK